MIPSSPPSAELDTTAPESAAGEAPGASAGVAFARHEVCTPAWPHVFRQRAATAMLEDSDNAVFVGDQLGHRAMREKLHYAASSQFKRREKASPLKIAGAVSLVGPP